MRKADGTPVGAMLLSVLNKASVSVLTIGKQWFQLILVVHQHNTMMAANAIHPADFDASHDIYTGPNNCSYLE